MRVYDPQTGDPYDGEPVDCAELKRLGGYTDTPPANPPLPSAKIKAELELKKQREAVEKDQAEAAEKARLEAEEKGAAKKEAEATEKAEAMTNSDLKDALSAARVEFPSGANKAALVALYVPVLLAEAK